MSPLLCAALLLVLPNVALGGPSRLVVVSTIFPLTDLARSLLPPETEAVTLLPAGANPHTFEPTPQQVAAIARASLLLEVGGDLDTWARKLLAARSTALPVFTLTRTTPLLAIEGDGAHAFDPHVWLDPVRMRDHAVPALARLLVEVFPDLRTHVEERRRTLQEQLSRLDEELQALLAPVRGASYVALHSAWRYFAARYGLVEAGTLEPFPGKELSAREMAELARKVRTSGAKALFVERGLFSRTAAAIAAETGLRLVTLDPYGDPQAPGFDGYDAILRTNAQRIREALR